MNLKIKQYIPDYSFEFICICFNLFQKNYFKDAWNVFDFITVVGSITDVVVTVVQVNE